MLPSEFFIIIWEFEFDTFYINYLSFYSLTDNNKSILTGQLLWKIHLSLGALLTLMLINLERF